MLQELPKDTLQHLSMDVYAPFVLPSNVSSALPSQILRGHKVERAKERFGWGTNSLERKESEKMGRLIEK